MRARASCLVPLAATVLAGTLPAAQAEETVSHVVTIGCPTRAEDLDALLAPPTLELAAVLLPALASGLDDAKLPEMRADLEARYPGSVRAEAAEVRYILVWENGHFVRYCIETSPTTVLPASPDPLVVGFEGQVLLEGVPSTSLAGTSVTLVHSDRPAELAALQALVASVDEGKPALAQRVHAALRRTYGKRVAHPVSSFGYTLVWCPEIRHWVWVCTDNASQVVELPREGAVEVRVSTSTVVAP